MFDGQFYPYQPIQFMEGLLTPIIGAGDSTVALGVKASTTSSSVADASQTVSLPPGIVAGNLLIVFLTLYGNRGPYTWPSGWVALYDDLNNNPEMNAFYKIADGTEGASITVSYSGTSARGAHNAYLIEGYQGTPEAATYATGSSATANPGNLAPSWGSAGTLWIAAAGSRRTANITSAPTGYSPLLQITQSSGPNMASAVRILTAASENPGTFALGSSVSWSAGLIAVRPA